MRVMKATATSRAGVAGARDEALDTIQLDPPTAGHVHVDSEITNNYCIAM